MKLYTIPALYCPFVSRIHPDADALEEHTLQWILDFKLVDNLQTFKRYRQNRFPLFIARTFPDSDFINLCAWCDLNTLLFIVDDSFDENDVIKDKSSFDEFRSAFMGVLTDHDTYTTSENPVFAALSDLWGRLVMRSTRAWQAKFIGCIHRMFDGLYWQFKNVMLGMLPTFEDYIRIRQYLGASHLSTDSLEVTGKIRLAEEVYADPVVSRLTELSRNGVCFANDLFSLGKESEESHNAGEYNLVGVMRRKYKLTIPEAIKAAADYHDNLVREFIALSKAARHFDAATNEMVEKYVHALEVQMIANIEWSTKETDRYPHRYEGADQKTQILN
ncbi:MAG TPA: hypothetical protein VL978_12195 [Puia sp.]|nr:hypothetical protein [Puia sp.]